MRIKNELPEYNRLPRNNWKYNVSLPCMEVIYISPKNLLKPREYDTLLLTYYKCFYCNIRKVK